MDRYVTGTKAPNYAEIRGQILNEKTLADVKRIKAALDAAGLEIDDPQFLFRADGSVVFADPGRVYPTVKGDFMTQRELDLIASYARDAIRDRGRAVGGLPH